ncbi:hypothetical protein HY994_00300 [Candidatus Micrarchaeota archaeon]|nr:hypothetical protein [Candidatus Micrarchaeota archaeon]
MNEISRFVLSNVSMPKQGPRYHQNLEILELGPRHAQTMRDLVEERKGQPKSGEKSDAWVGRMTKFLESIGATSNKKPIQGVQIHTYIVPTKLAEQHPPWAELSAHHLAEIEAEAKAGSP